MLLFYCNLRNFETMEKCYNPYLPVVVFRFLCLYMYVCAYIYTHTHMDIDAVYIMGIWYVCLFKTFGRCAGTYWYIITLHVG